MDRNIKDNVDGWEISFNRNVHMYCHALTLKKGQRQINIDCEDSPTNERIIGIWLNNLGITNELNQQILQALLKWTKQYEVKFQIYVSKDEFFTNR